MAKFKKKPKKSRADELEEMMAEPDERDRARRHGKNDLLMFMIGLLMFGGGLFMILQRVTVSTSWGHSFYHIGGWNVPNGMIMLPLLIGIVMLFVLDRKIFGWIVTGLGILFILLTVIMSVKITWRTTSAYEFIMMFGLAAAGGGMLLKTLFTRR